MTPRRRLSAFDECDCDRPDQLEHRPATEENRLAALNAPQAIPGTGAIGGSVRVGAAHGGAWPDPVDPSTAGLDVLGVRLILAGHPLVTAILACVAATVWLVLTYGVPASLLLTEAHDSVLGGVNGSWLLWIVATQSLSIAAAIVVPAWPSQAALLAPVAAGMWSVGVLIYLMVVTLIMLRWLTVPMTPATLGPPVLDPDGRHRDLRSGRGQVPRPAPQLPVVGATADLVEGFTYVLWAFGTWWIPLLIILGS